ncbi:DUF896 domain-containing protein [Acholeplasma granularum]|uniref:DUF896 domain-containing protein n=1 Tax=Acholeplasma granularum TaxID=264635 RepID=UPI0004B071DF|nr:DUF896 domain-containing protein [Acholeplasma granularum]
MKVTGIHHISTIVWHAQENIDFYAGVLGLKLIKKTLNFDDHQVYHLYFGNDDAQTGSAITFFPWPNTYKEGMVGDGQVGVTSYMIPVGSMDFWKDRFNNFGIKYNEITRFNDKFLQFVDPHGIKNELVETDFGPMNNFEFNGVTKDVAIKGFFGAVLYSSNVLGTKSFLLDDLKLKLVEENDLYIRFESDQELGRYVDLYKKSMGQSKMGAGSVHHIAFGVNETEIESWKTYFEEKGYHITGVKDRKFFKSIYFREPGGTIIELATNTPGFEQDSPYLEEPKLFMPPHFENLRSEVETKLMPLFIRPIKELRDYPYQNKEEYLIWKAHQELLEKINYYARESKVRKLSKEELSDREILRKKYLKNIRGTLENNLNSLSVEDENGNYVNLKKKEGIKND